MASHLSVHLNAFLSLTGYHEAGWRVGTDDPFEAVTPHALIRAARTAERGKLDSVFLADAPNLPLFRAEFTPQVRYEPVTMLAALAVATEHIGLVGTASTTYNDPFELARRLSTADHLSGGRVGWNVVTTGDPEAARNFGRAPHPDHDERYARAHEFVDVVRRLWRTWEAGSVLADRQAGRWSDLARVHEADFDGAFYSVRGGLPIPRSAQGEPVLAQAGSSKAGVAFAGRIADLVFTPQPSISEARAFRERLASVLAAAGRSLDQVRVLPGIAFVLGSTEEEAKRLRRELEESVDPEFRWRQLANNAGLDMDLIDPHQPLSADVAATAPPTTFAQHIVAEALNRNIPFIDLAQVITGLPGGLEFTGTPEQMADLMIEWVGAGACDGFTIQPTTLPDSLDRFVDHVVPILQARGVHRTEYAGSTLRENLGLQIPE